MKYKKSLALRVVLILYIIIFSTFENTYSQEWNIVEKDLIFVRSEWTNSNGLPVNTVFRTVQDTVGFIWMATEEGLVRFDGRTFKTFNQNTDSNIQTPTFNDLTQAKKGGIYAANSNALVHASFNNLEVFNCPAELGPVRFTAIVESETGEIYLGTQNGNIFYFDGKYFHKIDNSEEFKIGYIREMKDFGKNILFGGPNGFFSFNKDSKEFQDYPLLTKKDIRTILTSEDGNVYIGTRLHGLYRLTNDTISKVELPDDLGFDKITALEDSPKDKSIWVGTTSNGIYKITSNQINTYPNINTSLNEVWDIYEDDQNAIWVSGLGIGVSRFSQSTMEIINEKSGLNNSVILATLEDSDQNIWLGTPGGGLNRVSPQGIQNFSAKDGLSHDLVLSLAQRGDDIFVGTGNGINKINLKTLKIEKNYNEKIGLKEDVVYSLLKDSKENIWIGTINGILQKLLPNGHLKTYQLQNSFDDAEIIFGMEDSTGILWFGTFGNGFFSLNKQEELQYFPIYDVAPSQMATSIWQDLDGDIWIGTPDGLILRSNGELKIFNKKNGLEFEGIFKIIPDEDGLLWFSGNHGIQSASIKDLMKLKKSDNSNFKIPFRLFDKSDGILNNEFNGGFHPAGYKLSDGKLIFPSMDGAVIIDPKNIHAKKSLSPPYIESLNFENKEIAIATDIQVPAGVNFFNIKYGNIEFEKPLAINYTYRIKELGNGWINNENRNTAFFTGLAPGTYEFEVKAEQFGQITEIASMNFTVNAFFYQTFWFKVLAFLCFFILGFGVRALIMNKRLKIVLEQKIQSQTQDLHLQNQSLTMALDHLEKHNKLLEEVAWTQSHQFRGPLSKILGMIQALRNYDNFQYVRKSKEEILGEIEVSTKELDIILRKLNSKLEEHDCNK